MMRFIKSMGWLKSRDTIFIHQGILFAGVLTYLVDPDDVVWRFIKHAPQSRMLEHLFFGIAAILIGIGTWLCTQQAANDLLSKKFHVPRSRVTVLGEILNAVGIASLLPLSGSLLFISGDIARVLSLKRPKISAANNHSVNLADNPQLISIAEHEYVHSNTSDRNSALQVAFRGHAGWWLAFISMTIFSFTLSDRLAGYMFAGTAAINLLIQAPRIAQQPGSVK
jgi:hypothetical protein